MPSNVTQIQKMINIMIFSRLNYKNRMKNSFLNSITTMSKQKTPQKPSA